MIDEREIARELASRNNYNLIEALKSGLSFQDVIQFLSLKETTQDKHLEILLCPPKYLSADIPNNRWMKDLPEEERHVNIEKAMAQFFNMYTLFSQDSFVYLLPPKKGLQDQVYTANAGAALPHLYKTMLLSHFKAEGRPGEESEMGKLVEMMGYHLVRVPFFFEGEAELKWLRDDIYFGGYGQRTDWEALNWVEKVMNCRVIKIPEKDPKRYHLDCSIFPLSQHKVIFATDGMPSSLIKEIEGVAEIISVSKQQSQWSITNNLRIGSVVYNATDISELKFTDKNYKPEKDKNEKFEEICRNAGLAPVFINLSEFSKSGAALSCCVLHLTQIAYPD